VQTEQPQQKHRRYIHLNRKIFSAMTIKLVRLSRAAEVHRLVWHPHSRTFWKRKHTTISIRVAAIARVFGAASRPYGLVPLTKLSSRFVIHAFYIPRCRFPPRMPKITITNRAATVFVTVAAPKNPEDKILHGVRGLFAEYERAKISERTNRHFWLVRSFAP